MPKGIRQYLRSVPSGIFRQCSCPCCLRTQSQAPIAPFCTKAPCTQLSPLQAYLMTAICLCVFLPVSVISRVGTGSPLVAKGWKDPGWILFLLLFALAGYLSVGFLASEAWFSWSTTQGYRQHLLPRIWGKLASSELSPPPPSSYLFHVPTSIIKHNFFKLMFSLFNQLFSPSI